MRFTLQRTIRDSFVATPRNVTLLVMDSPPNQKLRESEVTPTPAVLSLAHTSSRAVNLTGGKASSLSQLLASGFNVPPGFVVTSYVYREMFSQLRIDHTTPLAYVQQKVLESELAPNIQRQIEQQHLALQSLTPDAPISYAVRSSATAEDLEEASFAGQYDTYHNILAHQLADAVIRCWASLWSPNAIKYRNGKAIAHHTIDMAVLIQVMVEPETSGVTFSLNPITNNEFESVTEACSGLGTMLVDGRITADKYITRNDPFTLLSSPVPRSGGSGCLDKSQVHQVHDLAQAAARFHNQPQDIEWAIKEGQLYLLQSRAITTLAPCATMLDSDIPAGKYVLFKPVMENFTEPLLPLSSDIYYRLIPILTIIKGRAYQNLGHIKAIFPFRVSDTALAQLLYLEQPKLEPLKLRKRRLIPFLAAITVLYLCTAIAAKRSTDLPNDFMAQFRFKIQAIREDAGIDAMQSFQALFLKPGFFDAIGSMPLLVNLLSTRYVVFIAIIDKLLTRWLSDPANISAIDLCTGGEGIASIDMGYEIKKLAVLASQQDSLKQLILTATPSEVLAHLNHLDGVTEFTHAFDQFLATHGHRCLKEFELNQARWLEDPSPIIAMIKNHLNSSDTAGLSLNKRTNKAQQKLEIVETKLQKLPFESVLPLRTYMLRWLLGKARYFIRLRENSRFYHIMVFGLIRDKVLALEKQLLQAQKLEFQNDIFFLKWDEIVALKDGLISLPEVSILIRQRRALYLQHCRAQPEKCYGLDQNSSVFSEHHTDTIPTQSDDLTVLQGQTASLGQVSGYARVILDPNLDALINPGEILVAPYTDPAWTPLFLNASAAVVEVGSSLSHAGTIAREYGMPCVVDVNDCTTRINTGDYISVDGNSGKVTVLRH